MLRAAVQKIAKKRNLSDRSECKTALELLSEKGKIVYDSAKNTINSSRKMEPVLLLSSGRCQ